MRVSLFIGYVIAFTAIAFGCASRKQSDNAEQKDARDGLQMEHFGIMSSGDYQHLQMLSRSAIKGQKLGDGDVEWAITLLNKPSRQPGMRRSAVMLLFLNMHTVDATQRQEIRAAMLPLLGSKNKSEAHTAQVVLKKIG